MLSHSSFDPRKDLTPCSASGAGAMSDNLRLGPTPYALMLSCSISPTRCLHPQQTCSREMTESGVREYCCMARPNILDSRSLSVDTQMGLHLMRSTKWVACGATGCNERCQVPERHAAKSTVQARLLSCFHTSCKQHIGGYLLHDGASGQIQVPPAHRPESCHVTKFAICSSRFALLQLRLSRCTLLS